MIPDWSPLLRAARYLGVAPWELAQQPEEWTRWAMLAETAEAGAGDMVQRGAQPIEATP